VRKHRTIGESGLTVGMLFLALAAGAQNMPPGYPEVPASKTLVEIRFEGDYQRLEELAKRLQAEIVRFDPPLLRLLLENEQLPALRQEGYAVRLLDPDEVFEQLVRVEPPADALVAKVKGLGGHLVQREPAYAVFRVSRRELRSLQREGVQVRPIREGDLVPRSVEIAAADESAIAAVVAAGVDFFDGRDGLILGVAFDDQIESLRRQGLKVRVVERAYPPR
jgi:hypothetical protein